MTAALLLIAVGLLLVALLVVLVCRSEPSADDSPRLSGPSMSLAAPQLEDFSEELLHRIFGTEDSSFIRNKTSKEVQELFIAERKELAFCWLSQVRRLTNTAMHLHVMGVGKSESLQPMLELELAIEYLIIQVKCGFVALVLLLEGPTALRSMVARAGGLSDQVRALVEVASRAKAFSQRGATT